MYPAHLSSTSSMQTQTRVRAETQALPSTSAAIANFKPTPREVIKGIAPHVLDERCRRKRKHPSQPYWCQKGESSPLRVSAVITWDSDDHSIFMEQLDTLGAEDPAAKGSGGGERRRSQIIKAREILPESDVPPVAQDKPRWRVFRVDIFKIIAIKLKPAKRARLALTRQR